MNRIVPISLIVLFASLSAVAQQAISINELVQKVYEQRTQDISDEYKLPWIEEINVRSETRDWRLREQRYALRISPVTLRERRASSKLYNSWQQEIEYLKLEEIYDKVASIHEDWVKQDFISRRITILEKELAILADVEKVAAKSSAINANNLDDLIATRTRIATLNNSINLQNIQRQSTIDKLSQSVNGEYIILPDTINLSAYQNAIQVSLVTESGPNMSQGDIIDLQTIQHEEELEKAEQNRVLDFLALEYRGPHDIELERRVSMGVSLNLPFFGANNLSLAKLKVEREKEEYRIEKKKGDALKKLDRIKSSIKSQLAEYESYRELYERIEKENLQLITNMEAQALINPKIRLNHQIQVLEHQISLLNLKETIVNEYLDYLQATDKYVLGMKDISTTE